MADYCTNCNVWKSISTSLLVLLATFCRMYWRESFFTSTALVSVLVRWKSSITGGCWCGDCWLRIVCSLDVESNGANPKSRFLHVACSTPVCMRLILFRTGEYLLGLHDLLRGEHDEWRRLESRVSIGAEAELCGSQVSLFVVVSAWLSVSLLGLQVSTSLVGWSCTTCTVVPCQLDCCFPQYTLAWLWTKSKLSADTSVKASCGESFMTPLSTLLLTLYWT